MPKCCDTPTSSNILVRCFRIPPAKLPLSFACFVASARSVPRGWMFFLLSRR